MMEEEVQSTCQLNKECSSPDQELLWTASSAIHLQLTSCLAALKCKLKALLPDAVHLIFFVLLLGCKQNY